MPWDDVLVAKRAMEPGHQDALDVVVTATTSVYVEYLRARAREFETGSAEDIILRTLSSELLQFDAWTWYEGEQKKFAQMFKESRDAHASEQDATREPGDDGGERVRDGAPVREQGAADAAGGRSPADSEEAVIPGTGDPESELGR